MTWNESPLYLTCTQSALKAREHTHTGAAASHALSASEPSPPRPPYCGTSEYTIIGTLLLYILWEALQGTGHSSRHWRLKVMCFLSSTFFCCFLESWIWCKPNFLLISSSAIFCSFQILICSFCCFLYAFAQSCIKLMLYIPNITSSGSVYTVQLIFPCLSVSEDHCENIGE